LINDTIAGAERGPGQRESGRVRGWLAGPALSWSRAGTRKIAATGFSEKFPNK